MVSQTKLAFLAVLVWTFILVLLFVIYFDPLGSVLDSGDADPHFAGSKKDGRPVKLTDCSIFPELCSIDFNECTIDRRKELTWHEFKWDFVYQHRPVIIEGGVDPTWKAAKWKDDPEKMFSDLSETSFVFNGEPRESYDEFETTPVDANVLAHSALIGAVKFPRTGGWWKSLDLFSRFDIFTYIQALQGMFGFENYYENNWVIMGPTGAGTTLHKDYYDTSFMNACIRGSKFWVTLERDLRNKIGDDLMKEWENMSNHEWFIKYFPKLKSLNVSYNACRQKAGEIIWVPSGFYHQTVNFERSIAVSSNYISLMHLDNSIYALTYPASSSAVYLSDPQERCDFGFLKGADNSNLRAIYSCVALRALDINLWQQTTCGTKAYQEWLDENVPVASFSNLDKISNSKSLMDKAVALLESPGHEKITPMVRKAFKSVWNDYLTEKEGEIAKN